VIAKSCQRLKTTGIPTWSWASLQSTGGNTSHITYWHIKDGLVVDSRFKLVSVDSIPSGRNPFGSLRTGALTLEGAGIWTTFLADAPEPEYLEFFTPKLVFRDEENSVEIDDDLTGNMTEVSAAEALFCLLLGAGQSKAALYRGGVALVSKKTTEGVFERVGILALSSEKLWF
jgi:hypothetical protein